MTATLSVSADLIDRTIQALDNAQSSIAIIASKRAMTAEEIEDVYGDIAACYDDLVALIEEQTEDEA